VDKGKKNNKEIKNILQNILYNLVYKKKGLYWIYTHIYNTFYGAIFTNYQ